jgi:glycosyltransferase involved in cell wall biosynthesis
MTLYQKRYPRVAFLPDTFHEVNGVAHTSRHLEAFARRRQIPFLSIHAGPASESSVDGSVVTLQLERGPARFALDSNLDYDPFLMRYAGRVQAALQEFKPDLLHLTGPGDMGMLGYWLGLTMRIPLVISWHTSLHEYAGRRLERLTGCLGDGTSHAMGAAAQGLSLQVLRAFYRQANLVMAPNQELIDLTRKLTNKPVHLMKRGVDTALFNPAKRSRSGGPFQVGYVGRLTPEKNVRFLAEVGRRLSHGPSEFEIVIVGEGNESGWLKQHVPNVRLTGVLRGEELARAYADLDLFAFPSMTDTYGNVILEAMASGVPCVVTNSGGPKFLVADGVSGLVASNNGEFIDFVETIARTSAVHRQMRAAAREFALKQSWDSVFEGVYDAYESCLPAACAA